MDLKEKLAALDKARAILSQSEKDLMLVIEQTTQVGNQSPDYFNVKVPSLKNEDTKTLILMGLNLRESDIRKNIGKEEREVERYLSE